MRYSCKTEGQCGAVQLRNWIRCGAVQLKNWIRCGAVQYGEGETSEGVEGVVGREGKGGKCDRGMDKGSEVGAAMWQMVTRRGVGFRRGEDKID